jgi:hypothetical protein
LIGTMAIDTLSLRILALLMIAETTHNIAVSHLVYSVHPGKFSEHAPTMHNPTDGIDAVAISADFFTHRANRTRVGVIRIDTSMH